MAKKVRHKSSFVEKAELVPQREAEVLAESHIRPARSEIRRGRISRKMVAESSPVMLPQSRTSALSCFAEEELDEPVSPTYIKITCMYIVYV